MTLRERIATLREPFRRGVTLALVLTLVGALAGAATWAFGDEGRRAWLESLTWGPGLSRGMVVDDAGARDVVRAGWKHARVVASWPAEAGGVSGQPVTIRPFLVLVTALWGLALGFALAVLWQSTASRMPLLGGFSIGAAAGLAVALALFPLAPGVAEWSARGLAGYPNVDARRHDNVVQGRSLDRSVILRSGARELARITQPSAGAAPDDARRRTADGETVSFELAGQIAFALACGLLGIAVGLFVAALARWRLRVAIIPLGVALGLAKWLALPFAPAALSARVIEFAGHLPFVTHDAVGLRIGAVPLLTQFSSDAGSQSALAAADLANVHVHVALLPLLMLAGLIVVTPLVLLSWETSELLERRHHRKFLKSLEEAQAKKEKASEPIPILPDERLVQRKPPSE